MLAGLGFASFRWLRVARGLCGTIWWRDDFDNIMHRDVDETDNDPDQISAALKSLKKAFPWKNISIASKM